MVSIKSTFTAAATGRIGFSLYWLAVFAIAILDDSEQREEARRQKCEQVAKAKPPNPPLTR